MLEVYFFVPRILKFSLYCASVVLKNEKWVLRRRTIVGVEIQKTKKTVSKITLTIARNTVLLRLNQ